MDSTFALPPRVASDFHFVIPIIVIANVLWYAIKILLRSKGYQIHWLYGHFSDVPNMVRLVTATPNTAIRVCYIALLVALLAAVAVFIFLAVRVFVDFGAA
jgi:hypothetical protein